MKAIWNQVEIANSDDTVVVEGNHYFSEDSVNMKYLKGSISDSYCPWKGTASYYSIEVNGKTNLDAAWYYQDPKKEAMSVKGHIAFWKGVKVIE